MTVEAHRDTGSISLVSVPPSAPKWHNGENTPHWERKAAVSVRVVAPPQLGVSGGGSLAGSDTGTLVFSPWP